jgi:hypothetical protein
MPEYTVTPQVAWFAKSGLLLLIVVGSVGLQFQGAG